MGHFKPHPNDMEYSITSSMYPTIYLLQVRRDL